MSDDPTEVPSKGRRWTQWLVRLLGLALLVVVIWKVQWRDAVVLADGTELVGTIVGDTPKIVGETTRTWDPSSRITFRAQDGAERTLSALDLRSDPTGPEVNEGLVRIVWRSDTGTLALGLALFGLIAQIGVLRWWLLLRAQDIRIPFLLAHRLTFVGFFFNNVVPGPTGGDVVKAVYAARRTDKRAQAIVTVVIDRVTGIIGLALIAAAVLLTKLDNPQYRELAIFIALFLAGMALAAMLFFSRRVRRAIRFEGLSAKLPGGGLIRQADEAIFLWRRHKRDVVVALLVSIVNQLCIQGLMVLFASALHVTTRDGAELPWTAYMVVLPVAFIVSALPMLPGGWGIREAAFAVCFGLVNVDRNPAVALSVLNGMTMLFWSLLGGIYFLLDRSLHAARKSPSANAPEKADAIR